MKRLYFLVSLLIFVVMFSPFTFSDEFEGVIFAEFHSKTMDNTAKIFIKGSKMKMISEKQISETNNGYPIIDFANKKGIFVSLSDKYYMELPLEVMIKNLEDNRITLKEESKEEYLGFNAMRYSYFDENYKIEIWGTKDITPGLNFLVGLQRIGDEGLLLAKANHFLYKNGIFPLKAVVKNTKGEVVLNIQINSISKQKVSDREFEVPSGYKKFSDVMKEKMKKSR